MQTVFSTGEGVDWAVGRGGDPTGLVKAWFYLSNSKQGRLLMRSVGGSERGCVMMLWAHRTQRGCRDIVKSGRKRRSPLGDDLLGKEQPSCGEELAGVAPEGQSFEAVSCSW